MIYFGGNGEEVSWLVPEFSRVPDWAALLVNYRGYGLSEGQPSETKLYRDALALYDRATRRPDIDSGRVIVMGRSLGTGVATYLASQRPVAGVVLISPYDSLVQVAREAYPFLPVNLLAPTPVRIGGTCTVDPRSAPGAGGGARRHRPTRAFTPAGAGVGRARATRSPGWR